MNVIGKRIKQKREQLGFSQDNLALELGITQPTYARLEKEDNRISISRLINIAAVLKTSVAFLIDEKVDVVDQQKSENLNTSVYSVINSDKDHIQTLKAENSFLRKLLAESR
jgi:transcriptional regulator with XRE-family HTH domain